MANVITGIRIIASLVLMFCPSFSKLFYVFYFIAGISDVLDGFVARKLKIESSFGEKFDTVADILFTVVVLVKLLRAVFVPKWLFIWIIFIALIKVITIIRGFVVKRQFVSDHTVLNKICGVLVFIIPIIIRTELFNVFAIITCAVATVAAIQEVSQNSQFWAYLVLFFISLKV